MEVSNWIHLQVKKINFKRIPIEEDRTLNQGIWKADFGLPLPVSTPSVPSTSPLPHWLKPSHAGVHRLYGPQPEEGEWGPQQAECYQPQCGQPSQSQVPHCGHHRSQLRFLHPAPHLTQGVNGETHRHEIQVCVCVCAGVWCVSPSKPRLMPEGSYCSQTNVLFLWYKSVTDGQRSFVWCNARQWKTHLFIPHAVFQTFAVLWYKLYTVYACNAFMLISNIDFNHIIQTFL